MATSNSNSPTVEIQLTKGYVANIDECDADLAELKWHTAEDSKHNNTVYARRGALQPNGKRYSQRLHRVILSRMLGRELLRSEEVDHINLNGLDNRRENLRLATHTQNKRNTSRRKDNTSGFKGVAWHKKAGKWRARIRYGGKRIHLGLFPTAELAYEAYGKAAEKYHGEFTRL